MEGIRNAVVHVSWKQAGDSSSRSAVGLIYRDESRTNSNLAAVARRQAPPKSTVLLIMVPLAVNPGTGLKQAQITHVQSGVTAHASLAQVKKPPFPMVQLFTCGDFDFAKIPQTQNSAGEWPKFNIVGEWDRKFDLTYVGYRDSRTQIAASGAQVGSTRLRPLDRIPPVFLGAPIIHNHAICGFVTGEIDVPAEGPDAGSSKGKEATTSTNGLQMRLLSTEEIENIEV